MAKEGGDLGARHYNIKDWINLNLIQAIFICTEIFNIKDNFFLAIVLLP